MDRDRMIAALHYTRCIRNKAKKLYARAYLDHLVSDKPEPDKGELGEMGAQAVRIELRRLTGKEEP